MSFQSVIEKYRDNSRNTSEQGKKFECLIKSFMQTYPTFEGEHFVNVWLWKDFPAKREFGSGQDVGIDIVAKTRQGEYWAVQCKCYQEGRHIRKEDVDTFVSTSSRSFHDVDDESKQISFSCRYFVDTSDGFSANAEESIRNQNPPVQRLGMEELASSDVDWDMLDRGLYGAEARKQPYSIRDHQKEAIKKAHEHYLTHDRGKMIMACGTGKTFTSLKIAEEETKDVESPTILFLAPSIALVSQTLNEWSAQSEKPLHGVCVCSDPQVSRAISDDSNSDMLTVDLALPASTSPREVGEQIEKARAKQKEDGGLVVVFSTYQSIDVVSNAQKMLGDGMVFDLCVADEAHRTTGVTLKGEEDSKFVRVHDADFIKAKKRLYMTATPRLYRTDAKEKAEENEAYLCSMDDPELYGEEFYRIGFGEAVKRDLLSDYKVMVLTLSEAEISPALQSALKNYEDEIPLDDSTKLIGCINALSKITKDTELVNATDPGVMHNAIAFCQSIKNSKAIVGVFDKIKDAYLKTLAEEEQERIVQVDARHVDGSMGATERAKDLLWLKDVDRGSKKCNVLMNVRCLSEGVDVPSLDAVLFLTGKNSEVDVVQSVGRVMRKSPGKKYGYIIIPVVIPANVEPEDALDGNERFQVVWKVLQALRAHDDRFNATVNQIELNKRHPSSIIVGGIVSPPVSGDGTVMPEFGRGIEKRLRLGFEKLQTALFARLVRKCGDRRYWEQWAQDVADIAKRHIAQIMELVEDEDSPAGKAFNKYYKGLRKNINPSVTREDAIEMLAQHFITAPVFEALFENYSFKDNNAISKSMQGIVRILNEQTTKEDNEKLEKFYDSVRGRVEGIDNAEAKQKIIIELYDKFFKVAFPKTVEKLGIVYTPVEVVDFIICSVEDVLKKEFGRSITDKDVHVLDPFTGTGTFIVRLLQSGIIKPEDMARKYGKELHACEIVLLAYYIASINIENTYHDIIARKGDDMSQQDVAYKPFNGIVLTDTFQMMEDKSALFEDIFPQNSKRVNELKKTPITVIMGNPPYSVGQRSGNDNAPNEHYAKLEQSLKKAYVDTSAASNKNSLYDSYIKAFRWSTDMLTEFDSKDKFVDSKDGIIGFVTNAGWLDGNAMDGMRKSFEKEFSSIYVFNLRGNQRTAGVLSQKEGGKIFGSGSRAPIAVTILVRKKGFTGKAKIHYLAVDDYLTREDKLALCKHYRSALSDDFHSEILTPDDYGDWLNKRNAKFEEFVPLAPAKKFNEGSPSFFSLNSLGLGTSRDAWIYNFSKRKEMQNILKLARNYNKQVKSGKRNNNPKCISWSSSLESKFKRGIEAEENAIHIQGGGISTFLQNTAWAV